MIAKSGGQYTPTALHPLATPMRRYQMQYMLRRARLARGIEPVFVTSSFNLRKYS